MSTLILRNQENEDVLYLQEKSSSNHILWELEGRCNFVCKYCYDSRVRNGVLKEETLEKWIQFLKDSEYEYIHISGGEPTLHPQLEYIVHHLQNKKICLSTNLSGHLALLSDFIKENRIYSIAISLDSLDASINDELRSHTQVVIHNIESLLKVKKANHSKVKIRIHSVLTKKNLHTMSELFRWAIAIGIDEVSAQPVSIQKEHPCYAELALTKEDLKQVKNILKEENELFHSQYASSHSSLLDYYYDHKNCYILNENEQCDNFIDATGVLWNCPRRIYKLDENNINENKTIVCKINNQCMTCLKRRFVEEE